MIYSYRYIIKEEHLIFLRNKYKVLEDDGVELVLQNIKTKQLDYIQKYTLDDFSECMFDDNVFNWSVYLTKNTISNVRKFKEEILKDLKRLKLNELYDRVKEDKLLITE